MIAILRCVLLVGLLLLLPNCSPLAHAVTIEFGSSFQSLPYVEEDYTFTNLGTSLANVSVNSGDGYLVGGTNVDPIRVRVTGLTSFDLESLDVEVVSRTWKIESSLGGFANVGGTGTIDFTAVGGFQGISYFEIIHDPAEANGSIAVDNIVVTSVPEPSTMMLLTSGAILLALARWRRRRLE